MKKDMAQDIDYKAITNTLLEKGSFSISEIESQSNLARTSIGNKIKKLVDTNILKKTAQRGSLVKYKLAINNKAVLFVFNYVDKLDIKNFAKIWDVQTVSAKKYIKKFVDNKTLEKIGTPPKQIIYVSTENKFDDVFSVEQKNIIEKNYAYTSPDGQLLKGVKAFVYWATNKSNRNDIAKLAQEYLETIEKYYGKPAKTLTIDATAKLEHVFGKNIYVSKLFHRDFEALPVFGKTYLSQLIRIAKSGQTNKVLMMEIVEKIQDTIDDIVIEYNIDCVGFVPPTIARKTQIMTFLSKNLQIPNGRIKLSKVKNLVPIQQKSLKKIEDRIINAKNTIIIDNSQKYENILLIDDVTGSGATLNETAKKIIEQKVAKKVYAFTITGSAKAGVFDVISEV